MIIFYNIVIVRTEQFYNLSPMSRLNQFINPETEDKGFALMRSLKNSIKRNIILPSLQLSKSEVISQCKDSKLTSHNFKQNDLTLLFEHLYNKEQMSVSDRNLIRRILLAIFPEKLISAGGKKMIQFSRFLNIEKGEKIQGNNIFYLILKGQIKINSPFYHKKLGQGMFFGHLQLMTHMSQISYHFISQTETSLICISSQGFYTCFQQYFKNAYHQKCKLIPKILTDKLQSIETLLLCDEMQRKQFRIGSKTNRKGEVIKEIIFIQEGFLNQNSEPQSYTTSKFRISNVIGLNQIILGEKTYLSNNFALEDIKGYSIQLGKFMKIVNKAIVTQIRQQSNMNSLIMQVFEEALLPRSKTQSCQPETLKSRITNDQEDIRSFIRVRKVNLPYNKSKDLSTEGRQSAKSSKLSINKYETEFVFIKQNSKIPFYDKSYRRNRMNMNFSRQMPDTKFYLENIQIPSFSHYQKCCS